MLQKRLWYHFVVFICTMHKMIVAKVLKKSTLKPSSESPCSIRAAFLAKSEN